MVEWIDNLDLPDSHQVNPEEDQLLDLIERLLSSSEKTRPIDVP